MKNKITDFKSNTKFEKDPFDYILDMHVRNLLVYNNGTLKPNAFNINILNNLAKTYGKQRLRISLESFVCQKRR